MPLGMCFTAGIILIITLHPTMFKINHCLYFGFFSLHIEIQLHGVSCKAKEAEHLWYTCPGSSQASLRKALTGWRSCARCYLIVTVCVVLIHPWVQVEQSKGPKIDTYLLLYRIWSFFYPVAVSFTATPVKFDHGWQNRRRGYFILGLVILVKDLKRILFNKEYLQQVTSI